jgi:hypothetical protein
MALLSALFRWLKPESQISQDVEGNPPPYENRPGGFKLESIAGSNGEFEPEINAMSVPQWEWTNLQCKIWLSAVLQEKMGHSIDQATTVVENFEGHGPTIFTRKIEDWQSLLGTYNGQGLYAIILEKRMGKGAVPRSVKITHWG